MLHVLGQWPETVLRQAESLAVELVFDLVFVDQDGFATELERMADGDQRIAENVLTFEHSDVVDRTVEAAETGRELHEQRFDDGLEVVAVSGPWHGWSLLKGCTDTREFSLEDILT